MKQFRMMPIDIWNAPCDHLTNEVSIHDQVSDQHSRNEATFAAGDKKANSHATVGRHEKNSGHLSTNARIMTCGVRPIQEERPRWIFTWIHELT